MITPENYPRLISLAVHELRTPAGVVGGYLRMLQRDSEPLSDRHRKLVDEAAKSYARLVALVSELSDIAKLDDGAIAMRQQEFDLCSLLAEVAESVHAELERAVRLEVQGERAGARMRGDTDRLRAAFTAIFRAILREKPDGTSVVAECRLADPGGRASAVVAIADAAAVQSAYDAAALPFDEKRGGVGLSLALARRVIELHGGRLWSPALKAPSVAPGTVTPTDAATSSAAAGDQYDDRVARGTAVIALPLETGS
jgi:K+-sensing histidine kinase KdpD